MVCSRLNRFRINFYDFFVVLSFKINAMTEKLFYAIRSEDLNSVKEILKKDASLINAKDQRGSTPLLLATYYGFEDITDFILSLNPELNEKDGSGNTALMGVCFKGYESIAEKLIRAGANVNETNSMGGTALHFAAMFNKANLVKLLLENGADKTIKDNRGMTVVAQAENQGSKEILDLLS